MRRLGTLAIVLSMAAMAAVACGGGGDEETAGDEEPTATTVRASTTVPGTSTIPATTFPPTSLTLRITDVRLLNSEESDNAMRVLLPQGTASASVTLTGLPSPNRVISVCQTANLDSRLSSAVCRTPASGEAVNLTLGTAATGVEIVQVGVSAPGPAGNTTAIDEVTIRYSASSREITARLPQIAAGESGGRPTFALTPASRDGAYRTSLTWMVIQVFGGTVSNAQLEMVQGGNVTNQAQGGAADLRLNGTVPAVGTEAVLRIQNTSGAALVSPKVTAQLP